MPEVITNNIDLWTSALLTKSTAGRGRNGRLEAYGIKKLRELILKLAIMGKLVPQVEGDDPANSCLIKARSKLRIEGKGARRSAWKETSPVSAEEQRFELPKGWAWARVNDSGFYVNGLAFKPTDWATSGRPIIRIQNLTDPTNPLNYAEGEFPEEVIVRPGNLLVSWSATLDAFIWNRDEAILNQHIFKVMPSYELVRHGFLYWLLKYSIREMAESDHAHGLVMTHINRDPFLAHIIAIPPLAEQDRIVAKIDELMALCDQLEQRQTSNIEVHQTLVEALLGTLTNVQSQEEFAEAWTRIANHFDTLFTTEQSIDQFKQTILQLAVMGKLVPQDLDDEPARVLLEKIEKEKERLVEEGKIKKEKPLPEICPDEEPFELPEGWKWARLGEIVHIRGGKRVSNGYQLLSTPTPHIYIRVSDMKDGSIDDSDLKYIDETMYSKIRQYIITKDDIYMTIVGATIGKCGLVPDKFDGMNLTENAARLTPYFVSKYYLHKVLSATFCQEQFIDKTMQVGVQKMALNRLASTLFPLPPLSEQHRIVAKVNELVALCDALKARLSAAQTTQFHLADTIVEQAVA